MPCSSRTARCSASDNTLQRPRQGQMATPAPLASFTLTSLSRLMTVWACMCLLLSNIALARQTNHHPHHGRFHREIVDRRTERHSDGSETEIDFQGGAPRHVVALHERADVDSLTCSFQRGDLLVIHLRRRGRHFHEPETLNVQASAWPLGTILVASPDIGCGGDAVYFRFKSVVQTSEASLTVRGDKISALECFSNAKFSITHRRHSTVAHPSIPSYASASRPGSHSGNDSMSARSARSLVSANVQEDFNFFRYNKDASGNIEERSIPIYTAERQYTGGKASVRLTCEDCYVTVDGYVKFEFEVSSPGMGIGSWGISFNGPRVELARVTLGASVDVQAKLLLVANYDFKRTITRVLMGETNLGRIDVVIGVVPLFLTFTGQIDGRVTLKSFGEATASTGFTYSYNLVRGVSYRPDTGVSYFSDSSGGFERLPTQAKAMAEASGKFELLPIITATINSVADTKLLMSPYVGVDIGFNNPLSNRLCTSTAAGLGIESFFGFNVQVELSRVGLEVELPGIGRRGISLGEPYVPARSPSYPVIPRTPLWSRCIEILAPPLPPPPPDVDTGSGKISGFSDPTFGVTCSDILPLDVQPQTDADSCAQLCLASATCNYLVWYHNSNARTNCFASAACPSIVTAPSNVQLTAKLDVCASNNGGCSSNAECEATSPGQRACVCKPGFSGDGITCAQATSCSTHTSCASCFDTFGCGWCDATGACQSDDQSCDNFASSACLDEVETISSFQILQSGTPLAENDAINMGATYTLSWSGGGSSVAFAFSYGAGDQSPDSDEWLLGLGLPTNAITGKTSLSWTVGVEASPSDEVFLLLSSTARVGPFRVIGPFKLQSPPPPDGQWQALEWSLCSGSCGGNNIRRREVQCVDKNTGRLLDDLFCSGQARPAAVEACNLQACSTSGIGCGNPTSIANAGGCRYLTESRNTFIVPYRRDDGTIFCRQESDFFCGFESSSFKIGCNHDYCCTRESDFSAPDNDFDRVHPCTNAHWQPDRSAPCSKPCGGGVRQLSWHCRIAIEGEPEFYAPEQCPKESSPSDFWNNRPSSLFAKCGYPQDVSSDKNWCEINDGSFDEDTLQFEFKKFSSLPNEEVCNPQPCEGHKLTITAWSECSSPCGGGEQQATPTCYSSSQTLADLSDCQSELDELLSNDGTRFENGKLIATCNTEPCPVTTLVVTAPDEAEQFVDSDDLTVSWTGGDPASSSLVSLVLDGDTVAADVSQAEAGKTAVTLSLSAQSLVPTAGYQVRICQSQTCTESDVFTIARQDIGGEDYVCSSLCAGDCTGPLPADCDDCRFFSHQDTCVWQCPAGSVADVNSKTCVPNTSTTTTTTTTTTTITPTSGVDDGGSSTSAATGPHTNGVSASTSAAVDMTTSMPVSSSHASNASGPPVVVTDPATATTECIGEDCVGAPSESFFDDDQNIIIIAAAGGGGLLLIIILIVVVCCCCGGGGCCSCCRRSGKSRKRLSTSEASELTGATVIEDFNVYQNLSQLQEEGQAETALSGAAVHGKQNGYEPAAAAGPRKPKPRPRSQQPDARLSTGSLGDEVGFAAGPARRAGTDSATATNPFMADEAAIMYDNVRNAALLQAPDEAFYATPAEIFTSTHDETDSHDTNELYATVKPASLRRSQQHGADGNPELPPRMVLNLESTPDIYVAQYDFEGTQADHLSLKEGDHIEVHDVTDNGWWRGSLSTTGQEGWFPASYVKELSTGAETSDADAESSTAAHSSSLQQMGEAETDAAHPSGLGGASQEPGHVSPHRQEPDDSHKMQAALLAATAMAAASNAQNASDGSPADHGIEYTDSTAAATTQDDSNTPAQSHTDVYVALYDFQPQQYDQVPLKAGDTVHVIDKRMSDGNESAWWYGRVGEDFGFLPSTYLEKREVSPPVESNTENDVPSSGEDVIPASENHASSTIQNAHLSHVDNAAVTPTEPNIDGVEDMDSPTAARSAGDFETEYDTGPHTDTAPGPVDDQRFLVLYSFEGNPAQSQLTIEVDNTVVVSAKASDWWYGRCDQTGQEGWFPPDFVTEYHPEASPSAEDNGSAGRDDAQEEHVEDSAPDVSQHSKPAAQFAAILQAQLAEQLAGQHASDGQLHSASHDTSSAVTDTGSDVATNHDVHSSVPDHSDNVGEQEEAPARVLRRAPPPPARAPPPRRPPPRLVSSTSKEPELESNTAIRSSAAQSETTMTANGVEPSVHSDAISQPGTPGPPRRRQRKQLVPGREAPPLPPAVARERAASKGAAALGQRPVPPSADSKPLPKPKIVSRTFSSGTPAGPDTTNSKPPVADRHATSTAKPVIASKPEPNAKPAIATKPRVAMKPPLADKPPVAAKPGIASKPAITARKPPVAARKPEAEVGGSDPSLVPGSLPRPKPKAAGKPRPEPRPQSSIVAMADAKQDAGPAPKPRPKSLADSAASGGPSKAPARPSAGPVAASRRTSAASPLASAGVDTSAGNGLGSLPLPKPRPRSGVVASDTKPANRPAAHGKSPLARSRPSRPPTHASAQAMQQDDAFRSRASSIHDLSEEKRARRSKTVKARKAIRTYDSGKEGHLSFKEGDVVVQISLPGTDGMCKGMLNNGKIGLYPLSYVE